MAERLSELRTEQSDDRFSRLDQMSVAEIVATMNQEDFRVPEAIRAALPAITAAISAAEPLFASGGRLVYVGAGTSGRLGVLDAAECPPTFHTDPDRVVGVIAGGPRAMIDAVEGAEDDSSAGAADMATLRIARPDVVVGLSASGRTPYVVAALTAAHARGGMTIALSCNAGSPLSAVADFAIEVPVGPEVLAGSTRLKAGSAQKQVLNMISTALMVRTGHTYGNLMVDLTVTNDKLYQRAVTIVSSIAGVTPARAGSALQRADREVKTAVVMLMRGVPADEARELLASAGGNLGLVTGTA